jgi:twinkle protein
MGLTDGLGGFAPSQAAPVPLHDPTGALLRLDEATWGRMAHDYAHGRLKGETTHLPALDEHFKWMPGYCNVWTGWPGDGKTEFIYQLLLLRAIFKGKKSAIFSPENMPAEHIYDQLIHALTGQQPDRSLSNCLPLARYELARNFVREHFLVVYPSKGMGRTPADLLRYFEAAVATFGVSHCVLDPWNKVDHSAMGQLGGYEPYLVNVLGQLTDWTVDTKQSLTTTAHPRRLDGMKFGTARPIPDGTSIAGGQTWENMAHIIGAVYRPYRHLGSRSELSSEVAIYLHKVKSHKLVGFPGSIGLDSDRPDVRLRYDWRSARYLVNDRSPLDCREAEQFYLTDYELRARDDMRRPLAVPATATPDYQPNTLRTAAPSSFDDSPPAEELPPTWSPNGRPITLPTAT